MELVLNANDRKRLNNSKNTYLMVFVVKEFDQDCLTVPWCMPSSIFNSDSIYDMLNTSANTICDHYKLKSSWQIEFEQAKEKLKNGKGKQRKKATPKNKKKSVNTKTKKAR